MLSYLSAIWQCRFFWMSLVKMDLRTRYRRSILGMGWSLLHPIAMTVTLCVVFHSLLGVKVREYGPYLLTGLVTWNLLLTAALNGCHCFFQGETYIRQYPAPLAVYPLRTALGGVIHFLVALVVVLALSWYCQRGFANLASLWCLIPVTVLLFVFSWSLAVLTGFANVHFQDTQHLAEVGFQILFYASPIMWAFKDMAGNQYIWLLKFNPMVYILDLVRYPILAGQLPNGQTLAIATGTIFLTAAAAAITVARLQKRLIFHL
jgi:ABC-type polysaccharide/polyol phosphate export permease